MKTKTINIYSFDELSKKAKDHARHECRKNDAFVYIWWKESFESLKTFCDYFNIWNGEKYSDDDNHTFLLFIGVLK